MTNMIEVEVSKPDSLWGDAAKRLIRDKASLISLMIVLFYAVIALLAYSGVIASDWANEVGASFEPPGAKFWLGTDLFGRNVFLKVIQATQVAMSIGFVTCLISIPVGVILGAIAGYYGGWIDDLIVWFYTTVSSIPRIILIISISFLMGRGILAVFIALGLTYWVDLCRLIRGEVMRHKNREYVQAADAIGAGHMRKLFVHILPNITHIIIINASLLFQTAIKSEVILSFIGVGVNGQPSWGTMISDARVELSRGVWWQLAGATAAMFVVVLAFNILGDGLRDALDPKLRGKD